MSHRQGPILGKTKLRIPKLKRKYTTGGEPISFILTTWRPGTPFVLKNHFSCLSRDSARWCFTDIFLSCVGLLLLPTPFRKKITYWYASLICIPLWMVYVWVWIGVSLLYFYRIEAVISMFFCYAVCLNIFI